MLSHIIAMFIGAQIGALVGVLAMCLVANRK